MNIIQFNQVNGTTIDNIEGQNRFGYAISDYVEFYEFHKNHKGSIISFYDYENGKVIRLLNARRMFYMESLYS